MDRSKIAGWVANSVHPQANRVDPDQIPLGQHCLLRPAGPHSQGKYGIFGQIELLQKYVNPHIRPWASFSLIKYLAT